LRIPNLDLKLKPAMIYSDIDNIVMASTEHNCRRSETTKAELISILF